MKKKSSARIHVSKVESAREMNLTRQSSMKTFEFKQRESKLPSTARPRYQSFIPPLKLLPKTISKLEKTPRPESSTLRFLTEPSKYSDPSSINSFITANNFTQQEEDSAKKIQKAWKKMKENKKTYSFIYFAFLLYKSRIKFPMHLWLLARRFPASISKVHYDIVVNYMKTRHYLFYINDKWVTNDFSRHLLTFDQYCKTNCILIGTIYDIDKIIKFVQILMRPLIKETLKVWHNMSETSRILSKQNPIIKTTYLYRSNFHELFWTFIFWRRWSRFKRTKDIEQSSILNHSIYLLEWNIYRAKKLQKRNIIRRAFCMRDDRLQYYAFITMRKHCLTKIKLRKEFNKIHKVANKHSMSLAFRSFLFYHVQCSIKKSLKYRVLSSWYKISDKSMINRACLTAMQNRKNIRLMMKTLSQWKEGVYENSLFSAYLFDLVQKKYFLLALKISFFLMKDFVHYQFVSSFVKWKKLILMKKRSKMFVNWSFNYSKENAIKSYLLDIFRDNCLQQVDHLNYFPFKSEMDKKYTGIKHSSSERAPISLKKRKSKLIKLIQSNQETNISITSFSTAVNNTLFSYQKVENFQCYDDDNWCQKATSYQIKALFYHLIIIKCYLNKGKFAQKLNKEVFQASKVNEYRMNNNLLTMSLLRKHRQKQDELFSIKRKLMVQKLNRDALLLAKKDVYLALVALNEANPQFSIEPKKTFKESQIIKEGEKNSPSSSSSSSNLKGDDDDLDDLKSLKRRQKHPLLNPISTLKDGITKTNRKARRPPKQLFTEETNQSAKNRAFRIGTDGGTKGGNRVNQNESYIVYEKHQKLKTENKEKFLKEKKRIEKEQLKNMPPPIDKMPTVKNGLPPRNKQKDQPIQLSSHLKMSNESLSKIMSSQDIDLSNKFSSKVSRSKLISFNAEEEEEEEEEESLEKQIDDMISNIEKISFPYINNDHYLNQSSINRRNYLTNKYFSILDVLLSKQKKPKPLQIQHFELSDYEEEDEEEEFEDFELPQNSVSRVLRALMPSRKNKRKRHRTNQTSQKVRSKSKLRRKPLFQDRGKPFEKVMGKNGVVYSKSNDPQFSSVLFLGDRFMSKLNLSGKLPDDLIFNDENSKKMKRSKKDNDEEEEEEEGNSSDLSSFDVPGFHLLLNEVGNFLKSGFSFELSIDEQEKKMISEKDELGNAEKVMLVMNKLARNAVKSESLDDQIELNRKMPTDEELVNIEGQTARSLDQSVSDRHSSRSRNSMNRPKKRTKFTPIKLSNHLEFKSTKEKRIRRINRKLKADSPIIIKRKFTFTQDLLNSIHEGSRIAHQVVLNCYEDVTKIDPFDGLDTLKKNIKLILLNQSSDSEEPKDDYSSYYSNESDQKEKEKEKEKERIIQRAFKLSSPAPHQNGKKKPLTENSNSKKQVYAEEFILSINGKQAKKKKGKRSKKGQKNVTFHPNTMKSVKPSLSEIDDQSEPLIVDSFSISQTTSSRPKTSWSNVRQEVNLESKKKCDEFTFSNFKVPRKNPLNHTTKMTKTLPFESPEFSVIMNDDDNVKTSKSDNLKGSNSKSSEKVKKLKNPKWIVESDLEITNDDIEFFLFTTPYIIPPKMINDALERQRKEDH